jgi:predicted transcriptional regulator
MWQVREIQLRDRELRRALTYRCQALLTRAMDPELIEQLRLWLLEFAEQAAQPERAGASQHCATRWILREADEADKVATQSRCGLSNYRGGFELQDIMAAAAGGQKIDLSLIVQIVRSYLVKNCVAIDQIGDLIASVYQTLSGLGKSPPCAVAKQMKPAVPIRQSVKHGYVVCLECGFRGATLRRHLRVRHGLEIVAYRARWKLPSDYPMTAPASSERRSKTGLLPQPFAEETLAHQPRAGNRTTPARASPNIYQLRTQPLGNRYHSEH